LTKEGKCELCPKGMRQKTGDQKECEKGKCDPNKREIITAIGGCEVCGIYKVPNDDGSRCVYPEKKCTERRKYIKKDGTCGDCPAYEEVGGADVPAESRLGEDSCREK